MSEVARTLPAVSFTVAARVIVLVAGFAASILTARGLGVEGRGQYYAVMTLAAIIAQVGNLGLSSSNIFLAARDRAHAWPLVVNSIWVALTVAGATVVFVGLFGDEIAESLAVPTALSWTLCVLGPVILVFTLCSAVLAANQRFFAMNMWAIVNAALALIGVAVCTALTAPSTWFVIATLLAALIAATGLVMDVSRGLSRESGWRFDTGRMRASVQFASRAYLALLAGFLIQRIGVALLTAYRGPAEIGLYSIAAQMSDVLIILPSSMATILFPMLVRDPGTAWVRTRQAILLVAGMMSAAAAAVWLLGEWAIGLLFGAEFSPSYQILLWLMPMVLAISIVSILSQFVVAEGFPRSLVALWLAGLALCAVAGLLLVEAHGAVGAAQAQSLSAVVVCAGVLWLTRRRIISTPNNLRV